MYINPTLMATFVNNILGKIILVVGIIYLTEKHTILGLLLTVIFIATMQSSIEGMSNGDGADAASDTDAANTSSENAIADATVGLAASSDDTDDTDDTPETSNTSVSNTPETKKKVNKQGFTTLNPARITSGQELIGLDEMLRPTESNMLPINKSMGVPPSENLLDGQLDLMNPVKVNGTINRGFLPAIF